MQDGNIFHHTLVINVKILYLNKGNKPRIGGNEDQ